MIWGAPIGLNEFIVSFFKLGINVLYLYIPIISTYLIYKYVSLIIKQVKNEKKGFSFKLNRSIIILTLSVLLSVVLLGAFYYPHQVIPDSYTFDSFTINKSDKPSFKSVENLQKLRGILNDYKCIRSLSDNISYKPLEAMEIDIIVSDSHGNVQPMHIVIADKQHIRYSAANTDFIYIIEDNDNVLRTRIIDFTNSL